MRFDEDVVRLDDHNASYNQETKEMKVGPTYKVYRGDSWSTAVSIHKWKTEDGPRKGEFVAVAPISGKDCIERIQHECSEQGFCEKMETGITPTNIIVYKFSVNVWRPVEFKKTKWAFEKNTCKPNKTDASYLQRLLKN